MISSIKLLDVITLTENIPQFGLLRGQVGTVVENLGPETFEFADDSGRAYALAPLRTSQMIVLHYRPQVAA